MVHKVRGSITVFLSFILVIVLALIGTLLDVARVNMADSYSYRSLVSAVDTEFTKYCSELYEDYHIYMLGNGHNLADVSGEEFINSMTQYLMYSFDSDTDLTMLQTPIKVKGTEFLDLSVQDCKVEETTTLADYNGQIFEDQVAQYMKYYIAGEAADGILAKLKLLNQSKETMKVVRKKNEMDEKIAKVDKSIMKLMQVIDGITFRNNQLVVTKNYTIEIQNSFAKKFCTTRISPNSVGINHNVVWDSVKDKYINPVERLKCMSKSLESYIGSDDKLKALETEISELEQKIDKLKNPPVADPPRTPDPNATQAPTVTPDPDKKEIEKEIKELEEKKAEKQKELAGKKKEQKSDLPNVRNIAMSLYEESLGVREHTVQAINMIGSVDNDKQEGMLALTDFDSYLRDNKDKLDAKAYKGLEDDYNQTKKYMHNVDKDGKDSSVVGLVLDMKPTLLKNKTVLDNTIKVMEQARTMPSNRAQEIKSLVDQLMEQYASYSIKELKFDYSTLTVKENTKNPLTSFSSLVGGGVLDLVIEDAGKLANTSLDSGQLISSTQSKNDADEKNDTDVSKDMADNISKGDSGSGGISDSLKEYEDSCESANVTDSSSNGIARKVLVNEYGVTNFLNLMDDLSGQKKSIKKDNTKEKEEKKQTKLKYEQEYLAIGGYNELDNVKNIIMRTVFMRTAVNYIALLMNSKCRGEAKETAIAMVGFTGMAPLVLLTSQLILIAWGFEEALVDTRALLDGKEVEFFKSAKNFNIEFAELLLINKELIKKKAAGYKEAGESPVALSYNDYLRIYILMVPSDTLSFRMMDLIQENMRVRYDSQFRLMNGIFGTKVSLTVSMPGKFLNIPFIRNFAGYDGSDATIKVSTEYSY